LNYYLSRCKLGRVNVGQRIKSSRVKRGLSQTKLAEAVGVAKATILRIEAGKQNPSAKVLAGIAKKLNVSADYLLGLKVTPEEIPAEILKLCRLAVDAGYYFGGFKDFLEWAVRTRRRLERLHGESRAPSKALFGNFDQFEGEGMHASAYESMEIPKRFGNLTKEQRRLLRKEAIEILEALEALEEPR
jgi:putative transcriptional regulator